MRAADPAARATSTGDTLGVVPKARLVSLDVFRGLTVAAMVLVNNPGTWRAVYAPLRHADWHGWTPTDLIFPFFLFIVGVAIPLGLGRRLETGEGRGPIVTRIVQRAVIIFAKPHLDLTNELIRRFNSGEEAGGKGAPKGAPPPPGSPVKPTPGAPAKKK